MRAVFALLLCTLMLAACGQKGPLTLPQDNSPASQLTPQPAHQQGK